MRGAPRLAAVLCAAALAAAGCGYALSTRWTGRGGVERVEVAELENRSTEPGLGAALTGALRSGFARRGAAGPGDARLTGEIRSGSSVPSSTDARSWRIAVEARVKLTRGAEVVAEQTFRREADYVAGADAVEAEGRRALALRRLADELAGEILAALER